MGKGRKIHSNDSVHLLFFILILSASGAAFIRDLTTSLALQCMDFSRALKIEKLKAPSGPGTQMTGT